MPYKAIYKIHKIHFIEFENNLSNLVVTKSCAISVWAILTYLPNETRSNRTPQSEASTLNRHVYQFVEGTNVAEASWFIQYPNL